MSRAILGDLAKLQKGLWNHQRPSSVCFCAISILTIFLKALILVPFDNG